MPVNAQRQGKDEYDFIIDGVTYNFGQFLAKIYDAVVGDSYTFAYTGDDITSITRGDGKVCTLTWDDGKITAISDWEAGS